MSLVHPRTRVSYSLGLGDQNVEFNTGDPNLANPVNAASASAQLHRIEYEHLNPSQLGWYVQGQFGTAGDILEDLGVNDSDLRSTNLFFGFSCRATVDEAIRLPLRVGPYLHSSKFDFGAAGDTDYETFGLKLSASPEYVILQRETGNKMVELSAFLNTTVGAGRSEVDSALGAENGYAFDLALELGVRYKFSSGYYVSLSALNRKSNYGATDSYDNGVVYFGLDDDFTGVALSFGRFW